VGFVGSEEVINSKFAIDTNVQYHDKISRTLVKGLRYR
jgi:hypothetical protein